MQSNEKKLIRSLRGESMATPPVWLMRQAGRYLPEYRETRAKAGGFLDLCLTPELAVEVTLQPIRRYGFDASILFSDILVVPFGLGQKVWFEEGVGPKLEPLRGRDDLVQLEQERLLPALAPVYETVRGLRRELPPETTLIGFAGAPWTVASYMVEGGSSKDFAQAKTWAYGDTEGFQALIDGLVEATVSHLTAQVEAGAEVLQLFDSWAGVWPEVWFRRWCLAPMAAVVRGVKQRHPEVPIILFPRGAGPLYRSVVEEAGADAISLDTTVPLDWAREELQGRTTLQGNLDPLLLVAGGSALHDGVQAIRAAWDSGPFVFNLGHGILPMTPPEHVAELMSLLRKPRD